MKLIELTIDGMSTDGRGIAHLDEHAVFIAGALPGDAVRVELLPDTKPQAARLIERISPSPHRVTHSCPHADLCIASPWGALDYSEQLRYKRELIERTLHKAVGDVAVLPVVPGPQKWEYRNRVSLHVWINENRIECGFHIEPRNRIGTPINECRLASPAVAQGIIAFARILSKMDFRKTQLPERIQIHDTSVGAGALLIFAGSPTNENRVWWEEILTTEIFPGGLWTANGTRAGVIHDHESVHKSKSARLMITKSLGHTVELHPAAFCQANCYAANLVESTIRNGSVKNSSNHVWDLYGGFGSLGLAAAGSRIPITVFEMSAVAETTFEKLATLENNSAGQFVQGDLLHTFPKFLKRITARDLIILDPPRSGVHPEVIKMIASSNASMLIYLSCNPARLARDLQRLASAGFHTSNIEPYDFFPQTPVIETLVILHR